MTRNEEAKIRLLRLGLRTVPAGLLLWWAFHMALAGSNESPSELLRSAWTAPPLVTAGWIGVAFTLYGVSFMAATRRFQVLLRSAGVELGYGPLLRAIIVATFFNTVLPGGVMGDAYRVWDAHGDTGRGSSVFGVITLERVLGLQALGIISVFAALFVPFEALGENTAMGLIGVASACAFGPFTLLHPTTRRLLQRLLARLLGRFDRIYRIANEALNSLLTVGRDVPRITEAALLSLVCQLLPVVAVWTISRPMASDVGLLWFAVIVPFVALMSMLPITIGGTGIREVLYVALFGPVGMPNGVALALSLSVLFVAVAWAAVGFALFSIGRSRTDSAKTDGQDDSAQPGRYSA